MGGTSFASGQRSEDLEWLLGCLWGEEHGTALGDRRGPRTAEGYLVFPGVTRPRFLLPVESRRAAGATLLLYNGMRSLPTRMLRFVLGSGLRTGIVQSFLRNRIFVEPSSDAPAALLTDHLRDVFGRRDVVCSIAIRPPGMFRKPVVQALASDGSPLGFVKVGWNDITRRLVRNEARALGDVAAAHPRSIDAPRLLHAGEWSGMELCITEPLPRAAHRLSRPDHLPHIAHTLEVAGIHGLRTETLGESPYWSRLRGRATTAQGDAEPRLADGIGALVGGVEDAALDRGLRFGTSHGDWVPWNLCRADGKLFVLDWEQSVDHAPVGLDVLHFFFQLEFVGRRSMFGEALRAAARRGGPHLAALGLSEADARALVEIYFLEILLRTYEATRAGATVTPRFFAGALSELEGSRP